MATQPNAMRSPSSPPRPLTLLLLLLLPPSGSDAVLLPEPLVCVGPVGGLMTITSLSWAGSQASCLYAADHTLYFIHVKVILYTHTRRRAASTLRTGTSRGDSPTRGQASAGFGP